METVLTRLLACGMTCLEVIWSNHEIKTHRRSQREARSQQSSVLTAGSLPQGLDEDRWIWCFKVLLISQTHVEDSLSVVDRPAVSAVWSVMLRAHGGAFIHASDNTRARRRRSLNPLLSSKVPETDSLIWFTLGPSLPSCLDSHLLYFFPAKGKSGGWRCVCSKEKALSLWLKQEGGGDSHHHPPLFCVLVTVNQPFLLSEEDEGEGLLLSSSFSFSIDLCSSFTTRYSIWSWKRLGTRKSMKLGRKSELLNKDLGLSTETTSRTVQQENNTITDMSNLALEFRILYTFRFTACAHPPLTACCEARSTPVMSPLSLQHAVMSAFCSTHFELRELCLLVVFKQKVSAPFPK